MARPKGSPKTEGSGRKKGTPNKVKTDTREMMREYIANNFSQYIQRMENLDDRDYTRAYAEMCKFVVPVLQSTSIDATIESKVTIEDRLKNLSES